MIRQVLLLFLLLSVPLRAIPVYIGTGAGGGSKGIYQADFDSATGKLTEPVLAVEYTNPGFLALHPAKPMIYACGTPTQPFADGSGSVAAFTIGADDRLEFMGEASSGGKGACHVAVDRTGSTVAVANYGDGSIATIKLDAAGIPGESATLIKNKGSGPNKPRQDGAHAHGVYFNKANTLLFVPDLGLDQVFIYPFDASTSKLGESRPSLVSAPGVGPRHLAFSADEKFVYVINELSNSVTTSSHDGATFTALASIPTLPADFDAKSTTAEIEVHPGGKFVYGSNRGHDSIVVYQRDAMTGELKFLQHAPCGGKIPRHFKIDPTGKWLLCGHQETNSISVLPLDPATGLLGAPVCTVKSPSPICLLFVP